MANSMGGDGGALPNLVDIQYVAGYLGVTVRHVRRLVQERRIPYVKWGRLLRFDLAEIANWIDKWRHGC
jgi:excisionase family DNA binding protein